MGFLASNQNELMKTIDGDAATSMSELRSKLGQIEGSEEGSPMSFAERRKAHNRARVTMQVLGIVGVVVVTMVVVMAYQMSALNSQIDELRAQAHAPARSRPSLPPVNGDFSGR